MPLMSLPQIESFCYKALRRCGASETQAAAAALELKDAEAEGIRSIGLGYIHLYLKHLRIGKVVGNASPTRVKSSAAALVVDAKHGFSHAAYLLCESELVQRARAQGVAVLVIQHAYSAGVLGWFVRRLAEQGLLALMFANSPKAVAAHGGRKPFFGTNPFAFAAPRGEGQDPVVVDMATASTARVNIVRAAKEGQSLEPGHAIDCDGNPTTDAVQALQGAQLPFGGAKGFGLGLMVDFLAGAFSGSYCSHQAPMFSTNEGGPPNVGQTLIALSPDFVGDDYFQCTENMLNALLDSGDVRLPGARRDAYRQQHQAHGVEVPQSLIDQINALSA